MFLLRLVGFCEVKKMSEAKIEETVSEDRISELPEDLLVQILSLLSTKDAVTTTFLSKQWRFIWTMLRTLKYKDKKNETDENTKSVWWLLDKSLQIHKAQLDHKIHVINKLHIELRSQCPTDADVGKWIDYAVERRVLYLKFKLLWSTDPISLPRSLYSCETLKKLSLSHKILVDFPPFSSCLPSLLRLELSSVVYQDEASLVRLLSSCPVLEALVVKRKKDDNVTRFSVKVPSLWYLSYINNESDSDDESDIVEDTGRCLVIDTPVLEYLTIVDYSEDSHLVENYMPDLYKAAIDLVSLPSDEFIRRVSSVYYLRTDEVVSSCVTIKFSELRKLLIYPFKPYWLEPLMLLLGNAPELRKLKLSCGFDGRSEDLPLSWNQPSYVPRCLSSQLEKFAWINYGNSIEEEEFLTYVFANSKCLKTAKISLRSSFDSVELRDLIFKELKDIPRVSTSSELLLR